MKQMKTKTNKNNQIKAPGKQRNKKRKVVLEEKQPLAGKIKETFTGTRKGLKKFLADSAKRPFLSCLIVFLVTLILGGILFFKYSILAQKTKPEPLKPVLLKEELHQEILEFWQEQERKFNEADFKEYPELFITSVATPEAGSIPGEDEPEVD